MGSETSCLEAKQIAFCRHMGHQGSDCTEGWSPVGSTLTIAPERKGSDLDSLMCTSPYCDGVIGARTANISPTIDLLMLFTVNTHKPQLFVTGMLYVCVLC